MTFRSTFIDGVHIVRWKEPQLADIGVLVMEIRRASEKCGKPIMGIAIMPLDSAPPPDDARGAMARAMTEILQWMETVHFVMEGRGFGSSIKRSALSGILLLGSKRGRVVVHANVEEALKTIAPKLTLPMREFEEKGRRAGVFAPAADNRSGSIK